MDSSGAPIDFLPSAKRDAGAAEPFLSKALGGENRPAPRVINTDKNAAYPLAIVQLKSEAALEENCCHRPVQYLEQCSGAGSSADQASGPRESAFPLLLGSLAYNRWLRGHSYDSQGQAWGSAAGAKVGMLHHFILGLFAAN